ncbi:MAG TPA: trypsin-like peptidase domain-containing protein [Acidimicrobiales bacterium]
MNEQPNEEQGSEEQGSEAASWDTTAPVPPQAASADAVPPVAPPAPWPATDPSVTQQHPQTQPVPHIQPPSQPPYPGQRVTAAEADVYPAGAHPAPTATWAPAPGPGTWGVAAAPGWGPTGPTPTPAPGGWGAGVGGVVPPTAWPPAPYGYYPAPPPPPARPKNHRAQVTVIASLVAVIALLLGASIGHATWPTTTTAAQTPSSSGGSGTSGGSPFPFGTGGSGGSGASGSGNSTTGAGAPADVTGIASKVSSDLVDINTNLTYQNEQAAGTGIVLTSNGEILTNNHVIDGATSISVTDVGNGQSYKANVVGYDRTGDIAVIQLVGASGLQTAKLASSLPSVGEGVVGVGNAGGTGGTPSSAGGSVTALGQSITASDSGGGNSENLSGLIQMNCEIQPGDSGGALVNAAGSVVGMDTAASTSTTDTGGTAQAYAIPIGTALSVAKNIEAGRGGSTIHIGATGFLGIQVQSSSTTGLGGSGGTGNSTTGAVVDGTLPASPGANAGLVQGDVITEVDNSPVSDSTDLSAALEPHHPGDVIHLQWTDQSGVTHTSSVTLAVGPPA